MNKRKSLVGLVALVLVMSLLTVSTIEAKKAPKLSNKKITLKVGQKKKLKVKNAKKVSTTKNFQVIKQNTVLIQKRSMMQINLHHASFRLFLFIEFYFVFRSSFTL